ncbi:MAG: hypothetical protein NTW58_07420, partial [Actinobacteria bacterium]|nr:hypothetical protein [Actinomycetota bacterium]
VMERGLIEIPDEASSADDLSPADAVTVAKLDELFWTQMDGRVSGKLVAAVRPVGGGMKLAALEEIVAARSVEGAGVMYVGDSITDAPPLAAVKAWGGVSLSFNGNDYALAAAEFAAASPDTGVAAALAKAFAGGGRDAVEAAVREWPKPPGGKTPMGREHTRVGLVAEDPDALAEASAAARRSVRGRRMTVNKRVRRPEALTVCASLLSRRGLHRASRDHGATGRYVAHPSDKKQAVLSDRSALPGRGPCWGCATGVEGPRRSRCWSGNPLRHRPAVPADRRRYAAQHHPPGGCDGRAVPATSRLRSLDLRCSPLLAP